MGESDPYLGGASRSRVCSHLRDDDSVLFSVRSLSRPVTWLGADEVRAIMKRQFMIRTEARENAVKEYHVLLVDMKENIDNTLGRTTKSSPLIGAAHPGITCITVDKSVENAFSFTPGTNVTRMSNAQPNSRPQPRRRGEAMSQNKKIHINGNSKTTVFG
ncbi:hypothetical protein Tco_1034158 [Tanacetum coccineum]